MSDFSALQVLEGLQFVPVAKNKQPIIQGWQTSSATHNLKNCQGVGIVCGKLSGNLSGIDVDVKYSLDGKLYDQYCQLVDEADPNLRRKMVVQRTRTGGYHWLFRCSKIEGNKKLANRPTTSDEKNDTYKTRLAKELAAGTPQEEAKRLALKEAHEDKVRVLIETRGEGGYLMCWPSEGYDLIDGDFQSIAEISPEEYDTLFACARQLNEIVEEHKPHNYTPTKKTFKGLSPFDDYNERGDVLELLQNHGWKYVKQKGSKFLLLRPGQSSAAHSGNYDTAKRWFSVFTTSTAFQTQTAYLPYAVYAMLEHDGDYKAAKQALYEQGFGDREEEKRSLNQKTPSRVTLIGDDLAFLAKPSDYEKGLQEVIDGAIKMGKSTGFESLDPYFLWKETNLVMTVGIDGSGKTVTTWFLALLTAMLHGWRWIIYSNENSVRTFMWRMIEFYWGTPIRLQSDAQRTHARKFIEEHFFIIKTDKDAYNYREIIQMTEKVLLVKNVRRGKTNYFNVLIDPYNGLRVDVPLTSKFSTHDYHYNALLDFRMFKDNEGCGFLINNHAITEALRMRDKDGYPIAPGREFTEGGGKFANKADDFFTIHRKKQHPTDWNQTEFHISKIKEHETGGKETPLDFPVIVKMDKNKCGFSEEGNGNLWNPVKKIHYAKPLNGELKF